MRILGLILKEIRHRKVSFLLSCLAVMTAVGLYIAFVTTARASMHETRKIMLGLGQNLRIIPKQTRMDKFWITGFSEHTMPQEYLDRFTRHKGFSYTHLTATLQKSITWRGKTIILTGILPEVFPPDKSKQKPMTFSVKPATVYVGFDLAQSLGIKEGDVIRIRGKDFTVARCLSQSGSSDNVRIYGHLDDIQTILKLPGQINEIRALECLCVIESSDEEIDPRQLAERELSQLLPEAKVLLLEGIAMIRQQQRAMISGHMAFIIPVVIVVCGAWIGVLAMMNVRERRGEIGLMRAIGYGSAKILMLFLGKVLIIGLAGALVGFFAGTALATTFGPEIFKITARSIRPQYILLVYSLVAASVFAVISSFIPIAIAISNDPSDILREE